MVRKRRNLKFNYFTSNIAVALQNKTKLKIKKIPCCHKKMRRGEGNRQRRERERERDKHYFPCTHSYGTFKSLIHYIKILK